MDIEKLKGEIKNIKEPRRKYGNIRHKLEDIIIIGLCISIDVTIIKVHMKSSHGLIIKA